MQGVLLQGVVDTGSDLTIMSKEAFKRVATVAKLRKRDFHLADKKAYSYDGKPFTLDGWLQLDLMFGEYSMSTPVYVKMDADNPLLLSEIVCRQLGIVIYHPSVRECQRPEGTALPEKDDASQSKTDEEDKAKVPTVRVKLLNSACLLPNRCTPVQVVVEGDSEGDLLADIRGETALIHLDENGTAHILLCESIGFTERLDKGTMLGKAVEVEVMLDMVPASVNMVSGRMNPPTANMACHQLRSCLSESHFGRRLGDTCHTRQMQLSQKCCSFMLPLRSKMASKVRPILPDSILIHQELYEFEVMPFGLTNAPAACQFLVQQLLLPLNSKVRAEFVNVYVDDVIVFHLLWKTTSSIFARW